MLHCSNAVRAGLNPEQHPSDSQAGVHTNGKVPLGRRTAVKITSGQR
jgi:hypothetical protein